MKCEHQSCGSKEKVWLPHISKEEEHGIRLHPYCIHCGAIKNISLDKPRKIGYYLNVLSEIRRNYRISDAQIRLIVNDLNSKEDFEDPYWATGLSQEKMFLISLKKYCNIQENMIKSLL